MTSHDFSDFKSGIATLIGRPNVGKSTLLNAILGTKVSIVSDKVQTTRRRIRGILNRPNLQIIFTDTPGIHKPQSLLGEQMNETAMESNQDSDVSIFVLDATSPIGKGDRFIAKDLPSGTLIVLNKIDRASPNQILKQLSIASEFGAEQYFPVSATTGQGIDVLLEAVIAKLPDSVPYFPLDAMSDVPESWWVSELVREQLLERTKDELPHSIECRITEWELPYIRCEIIVERDSQKPIVIGKRGQVLKEVGMAVRSQLNPGIYLELAVKVDKNWQDKPESLRRLGY